MFEALFPGWQPAENIALLVGLRAALNATLVALVIRAVGVRSPLSVTESILAVSSTTILVLVLRPGGLGLYASYVELVTQFVLIALAGYAASLNPTRVRVIATVLVSLGAGVLLLLSIPVYGEATVAP